MFLTNWTWNRCPVQVTHRYLDERSVVDGGIGVQGYDGDTAVLDKDGPLNGRHGGLGAVAEPRRQLFHVGFIIVVFGVIKVIVVVDDGVDWSLTGSRNAAVYSRVSGVVRGVAGVSLRCRGVRGLLERGRRRTRRRGSVRLSVLSLGLRRRGWQVRARRCPSYRRVQPRCSQVPRERRQERGTEVLERHLALRHKHMVDCARRYARLTVYYCQSATDRPSQPGLACCPTWMTPHAKLHLSADSTLFYRSVAWSGLVHNIAQLVCHQTGHGFHVTISLDHLFLLRVHSKSNLQDKMILILSLI